MPDAAEMAAPQTLSLVRANLMLIRCVPAGSGKMIWAVESGVFGLTRWPLTSTRHAG